jgi:hypothetical protein
MTAPAEFGRLTAFADEAVDRPGVDELADFLRRERHLGVALGDVDHFHAEAWREPRPSRRACVGSSRRRPVSAGDVQQRLLDEMRHEAGIRAVRDHGRGAARAALPQRQRAFAQRVVRAQRRRQRRIGVAARPRLDAGVEVQRAALARIFDQREARDIDRQVQQEVAGCRPAGRARRDSCRASAVAAGTHAEGVGLGAAGLVGGDDGDARSARGRRCGAGSAAARPVRYCRSRRSRDGRRTACERCARRGWLGHLGVHSGLIEPGGRFWAHSVTAIGRSDKAGVAT